MNLNRPTRRLKRSLCHAGAILLSTVLLQGCLPGTGLTMVNTGLLVDQKAKIAKAAEIDEAIEQYLKDYAASPCATGDDPHIQAAVDVLHQNPRGGFDRVVHRLEGIHADPKNSDSLRAGALYYLTALYLYRVPPNQPIALNYLTKLHQEFPGHYDCLFQPSEWRDEMIRKHLLSEGQTVDSFKAEMRALWAQPVAE